MKPTSKEASGRELPFSSFPHSEPIHHFHTKTDEEIWMALNAGSELAFNYLYRIHIGPMFRYGCQISTDKGLVKDCIQNVFIQLRKKRGDLTNVKNCKAYLFTCLKNEIRKKIRESNRVYVGVKEEEGFPISLSHEAILIQKEQECEKVQQVQEALNQLTTRQRQALLLLYVEGMSYQEIAQAMDFNEVKSARKLVYRALSSIRVLLKK